MMIMVVLLWSFGVFRSRVSQGVKICKAMMMEPLTES